MVATGLNYAFLLAAGRLLGTDDYGSLAALLGLLTVVLLPTGAVQLAVSREVSRRVAIGDEEGAEAFGRATLRLGVIATAPVVAVALALVVPLKDVLNIDSTAAVVLTALGLATALLFPIAVGTLLGFQRFHAVAALYVLPFALRLAFLAVVAAAGYRLGGAVLAAVAAGFASAALAIVLLRDPLRKGARAVPPALGPFLRYLWPVLVGLIGIAVLTNVDLLVVKARFSPDAGEYAAASAFARVAFFLPATILAVLFPRTAARQARGEDTADILGRSLLVTAAFGGLLALFYAMTGRGLVGTSFGAEFTKGGDLLVLFTVAMTLFALANVLVGFHLSRDETRYAWIVAGAVAVQVAVISLVPTTVRGVIVANVIVGTALLAAHELFVDTSVPALRAGFLRFSKAAAGVRVRRVARESLLVLLGATAFVCLLFWPLVASLGSMVVGLGTADSSGTIAWLWSMQHEGGYHLFGTTHHSLTGAPFGWDQGSGLNIQWLLPYYPAYLATKVVGPVAAFNLVVLSGYVLSGASMYLLVRYLGCARLVSAWAGMVYIVFPWHLARTPHASLVHLEFLPLLILALVAATRRPSSFRFSLVGLATLACWLTAGYFGTMALVAATVFALIASLESASTLRRRAALFAGLAGSALAATIAVAFLSFVSGVGTGAGLHRYPVDLGPFGLRPLELVVPAMRNLVFGGRLDAFHDAHMHRSNAMETSNYLGFLTIALAVCWIVVAWRERRRLEHRIRSTTAGLVGMFVIALGLALPSPVALFGHELWMPSRLLWEVAPAIRVPSRWVVLMMTALVPLAALGLQAAWTRIERRSGEWRGVRVAPVALVAVVMLASFLELSISPTRPRHLTHPLPPEYAALARAPQGIVADYPLVITNDHILWQTIYKRPLLNNAESGSNADSARRAVVDPGAPGAARALAFLGVTAIVTHADALRYHDGIPDVPNANWGPGYSLLARSPDGSSAWRVVALPAPALITPYGGFGDPSPPDRGFVGFPLVSSAGVGYFQLRAKEPGVLRLNFEARPPHGGPRVLRVADANTERPFTLDGPAHISLLVRVPRGLSLLLMKTDPPATSEKDAIEVSAPRAERASGTPDLSLGLTSPDIGF